MRKTKGPSIQTAATVKHIEKELAIQCRLVDLGYDAAKRRDDYHSSDLAKLLMLFGFDATRIVDLKWALEFAKTGTDHNAFTLKGLRNAEGLIVGYIFDRHQFTGLEFDWLTSEGFPIFRDCTFTRCKLDSIEIVRANFQNCSFDHCDFEDGSIEGTHIESCRFHRCDFTYTILEAEIHDTVFVSCKVNDANLRESDFTNVTFVYCDNVPVGRENTGCHIIEWI